MTISEALVWAMDILVPLLADPITKPYLRFEAEVLLAAVLNQDRIYLYTWPDKTIDPKTQLLFEAYIKRRSLGEPLAYILQQKEFWSLSLEVSPAVLIPRPETEILIETVLQKFPKDPTISVLELGTGSGAIALALAQERPHWQITATDVSIDALEIAKKNAKRLAFTEVQWLQGYWFEALPVSYPAFDVIISNPPYIAEGDPHLDTSLKYEPESALVSENEGYFALEYIIQHAPRYLKHLGWILLEHGATQAENLHKLLKTAHFSHIQTIKDLAGVNRVTLAQYKKI